jgi:hypothetical protein
MSLTASKTHYSIGDLGDRLHVQCWRIARLFEQEILPEPLRIGGRRFIPGSMVPDIVAALRERGCDLRYEPSDWEGEIIGNGEL